MTQAERVIELFGGVPALGRALKAIGRPRDRGQIHRWKYPKTRGGTGGTIPIKVWPDLFRAAEHLGFSLPPELLDPRPCSKPSPEEKELFG
jgi:hypothetical protein